MTFSRPRWLMPITSSTAPCSPGGFENFIKQRDQRSDTFERKALAAQIPLLQDLFEDLGTNQQIEIALLVHRCRGPSSCS